jgi:predicted amidohydrolase YtcJ
LSTSRVILFNAAVFGLALACAAPQPRQEADAGEPAITIYVAQAIHTMEPEAETATAVAIDGRLILDVGDLAALEERLAGRAYQIDRRFQRHVLLPGFIDNHLHPSLAAVLLPGEFVTPFDWSLPDREVEGIRGHEPFVARLAELCDAGPADEWLVAWGYHPDFHGPLSRTVLDELSDERAILVWHRSFHEIYLNSSAMRQLGLAADEVGEHPHIDWERGRFYETGLQAAFQALAPMLLAPERFAAGLAATRELVHRGGLTTIVDQGFPIFDLDSEWAQLAANLATPDTPFRTLLISNGLTLGNDLGHRAALKAVEELPTRNLDRVAFLPKQIKLFADGAFYSQLMQMRDGYLDGHHGEWLMEPEELLEAARAYWRAGYQIHVHVNGDLGVDATLDTLTALLEESPRTDHRFTLHHFGSSADDQIARIAELGVLVSANPYYVYALADLYSEIGLGAERAAMISRLGSLERAGVPVSLHSDLTMAPASPLLLAAAAVTRRTASGVVAGPTERLSVAAALRGVTLDAALAVGLEHEIGSIRAGKKADFTILEQDPFEVPAEDLAHIGIWGTILEGAVFPLDQRAGASRSELTPPAARGGEG